jgi:hypothetical protein
MRPMKYDHNTNPPAESAEHYTARLVEVANGYEREPSQDWAHALILGLGLARFHKVPAMYYGRVVSALVPHEEEILKAALTEMLDRCTEGVASFKQDEASADHNLDEWLEFHLFGYVFWHFEEAVACDWIADRILQSESLLPSLVGLLDRTQTAVAALGNVIKPHAELWPTKYPAEPETTGLATEASTA